MVVEPVSVVGRPLGRGQGGVLRSEAVPGNELVIALANVQYAGELLTSAQPLRVAGTLAPGFRLFGTRQVWVMAEHDPELVRTSPDTAYEIVLPDPSSAGPWTTQPPVPAAPNGREEPLLDALALAETRDVPLPVWQLLCAAAGTPVTAEELLALARRRPDTLTAAAEDAVGVLVLRFLSDASAHARRRARPLARGTQADAAEALLASLAATPEGGWPPDGPVARYATRALPMHAALAGTLPRVRRTGRSSPGANQPVSTRLSAWPTPTASRTRAPPRWCTTSKSKASPPRHRASRWHGCTTRPCRRAAPVWPANCCTRE